MTGAFSRLLNIEPGEGRLVGLLFFQYFCTGIASVFTQTAAFAIFLSDFQSDVLPYTYLVMGVVLSGLTLVNLQIGRRIGFAGQLRLNLGTQIGMTLLFALGLTLGSGTWLVFLLPVLFQLAVVYGNMTFWSLAGRLLDVRQGKRLFGLVASGEWMAIVILGFLMPLIVPAVGLANLLWLALVGATAALLLLNTTLRAYAPQLHEAPPPPSTSAATAATPTGSMFRNPYVLVILWLNLVWWVGFFFFDNIFYEQAARQFPNGEDLAAFLGLYLGILGILTLVTGSLLTGRILGLLGLRGSLLVLPSGLLVGSAALAAGIVFDAPLLLLFIAAVASRMWGIWIGFSVDQAAHSILYQPLPPGLRTHAQTTADGIVQPISIGVAGIALLALGALFPGDAAPLVIGALLLSAILLATGVVAGRGYVRMLVEALDKRRLRPVDPHADRTSLEILKRGLGDPQPGPALYCMRMLADISPETLDAALDTLLRHPSPHVRREALERVAQRRLVARQDDIRTMLASETSPQLRGTALEALGALGDLALPRAALASSEGAERIGAILGLVAASGGHATPELVGALHALATSSAAAERIEAARIAARLSVAEATAARLLGALIEDPEPAVRRAAIHAAGRIGTPALVDAIIATLEDRTTRSAASGALADIGDATIDAIARSLQHATSLNAKVALLRALGSIGTPAAQDLLLPYVDSKRPAERDATLRALETSGYRIDREHAQQGEAWLEAEALHANWLAGALHDILDQPDTVLVRAALAEQLEGCRERLFILLGFFGGSAALQRAREGLGSGDLHQAAYSHEILDMYVPAALRPMLLPLLDGRSHAPATTDGIPGARMRKALERLADPSEHRTSEWTTACARHALAALQPAASEPAPTGRRTPMELIEKVLVLRTVGIFDATRDEVLAEVASICDVVDAPMGTGIVAEGSMGDTMYAVASGRVRVHHDIGTLNELGTGEVFGEMALLDPEPRSASVTALVDTQLLRFDQQALFELLEAHPEVARGMLQVLTRRLRQAINREPPAA